MDYQFKVMSLNHARFKFYKAQFNIHTTIYNILYMY